MTQLPISAVHPLAPDHLSVVALFTAPINVGEAPARISPDTLETPVGVDEMDGGAVYHYIDSGVTVLVTPVSGQAEVGAAALPEHAFHAMITLFSPAARQQEVPNGAMSDDFAILRRAGMVALHEVYTRLVHALMSEEAAVGVVRPELGIVYPAQVINGLRPESRFLEWVYVAVNEGDVTMGRTRGLPLFGHLDLQITDSTHSGADVYNLLANTAAYVLLDSGTLMPGQTLGQSDEERIDIVQGRDEHGEDILTIVY